MNKTSALPVLKKTLRGPGGLRVVVDSTEVFPNDPGQGTPALVCFGRGRDEVTATLACASNEGELDCGTYQLTPAQIDWLHSIEGEVDDLLQPYWDAR